MIYKLWENSKLKEIEEKMLEDTKRAELPPELSKKYLCRYFMAGNCQKNDEECQYAHSIQELQGRYTLEQEFPKKYRQPVMPV